MKKMCSASIRFPTIPKIDEPSIQQHEIAPHEPSTTLMDLHKTLLLITNFENKKVFISPTIKYTNS
jgi:hypothetical protein